MSSYFFTRRLAAELKSSLMIEVHDADDVAADDFVGSCAIPLTDAMFDGSVRQGSCRPARRG